MANIKLAKALRTIDALRATLKCEAQTNEYNRGLYNGVEMMRAFLTETKPKIMEKNHGPKTIEVISTECSTENKRSIP